MLEIFKIPLPPCALTPLYQILAQIVATDNTNLTAIPVFAEKTQQVEDEYMHYNIQIFGENLDLLGITYFNKHNLVSIAPVLYS